MDYKINTSSGSGFFKLIQQSQKISAMKKKCFILYAAVSFILSSFNFSFAQAPVANFTANNTVGCGFVVVTFTDLSTNSPTSWKWNFGDGTANSIMQNPTHVFFNPGVYTITLTATNASGSDIETKISYITVYAIPTTNFTANVLTGCTPLTVNFTDLSTPGDGALTNWLWDFGDGGSSVLQNPTHVYNTAGTFKVSLSVTDANGCMKKEIKNSYITVSATPTASFTGAPTLSCAPPLTVNFTNTSTGGLSYAWDFGDGNTSALQNPSNNYAASGDFAVTLIVTGQSGCTDTITRNNYININTYNSSFSADITNGCNPMTVNFTDLSPGAVSWSWNFGDGTPVNNTQNPSHTYTIVGSYNVTLISTNAIGCTDTTTINNYITVNTSPTVSFTADDTTSCSNPFTVNFTDLSPGAVSWSWNFGDGTPVSNNQNPSHNYLNFGNYDVSLTITDGNGCTGTLTKNNYIQIIPPTADFSSDTTRGCQPLTVNFADSSTSINPISSWSWDFGDGTPLNNFQNPTHVFADTGTYTVTLIITDDQGCKDTVTMVDYIQVGIPPVTNFGADDTIGCHPLTVQFTDSSSTYANEWLWDFGDGGTSTDQNPNHTYAGDTGFFTVSLVALFNGCPDTLTKTDYIYVMPPVPAFIADSTVSCQAPTLVQFTDMSIGAESWHWDFGDGDTSNLQNPNHNYLDTGYYDVKLVVTNSNGCKDSLTQTNYIVIDTIIPGYTQGFFESCQYEGIPYIDTSFSIIGIDNWFWDFGDGNTDTLQNPIHNYDSASLYTVKLIVTTSRGGCQDSVIKINTIKINPLPTPAFNADTLYGCVPLTVTFTDSSIATAPATITNWFWDFGDGNTDTVQNPIHIYQTRGSYSVSLTVTDSKGCDSILTKVNYINPTFPYTDFTYDTMVCHYDSVNFTNLSTGGGLTYSWDFGDGSPADSSVNTSHLYNDYGVDTIFNVALTATDTNGCDSTIIKPVRISRPSAGLTADTTYAGCPPLFVNFSDSSSNNIISWTWDFGDGSIVSNLQNPQHVFSDPGTYTISLIVNNSDGCTDTVIRDDFIFVDGPTGTFDFNPKGGCAPLAVTFVATANNTDAYTWVFGDGSTATGDSVVHVYTIGDTYLPVLILYDYTTVTGDTCAINVVPPQNLVVNSADVDFVVNDTISCSDSTFQFLDLSTAYPAIDSWLWYFGDGDSSTEQHPSHFYDSTGAFTVTLQVTVDTCTYSLVKPDLVTIYETPVANFYTDTDNVYTNIVIAFIDSSTGQITSWQWDFGDGTTSTQKDNEHDYDYTGTYSVILFVYTPGGCSDSTSKDVHIIERIDIPNAFTPDHDGINDVYMKGVHLIILNRWGQTLYEGENGWDGTYKGEDVVPGTYFYIITFNDTRNSQKKFTGSVTLIRN